MTPADFRAAVLELAEAEGFPADRLVLGGDHLGPNTWQERPADEAMPLAVDLVRATSRRRVHEDPLDCSMPLQGETAPLTDAVVAERAAVLLAAAESAATTPGSTATASSTSSAPRSRPPAGRRRRSTTSCRPRRRRPSARWMCTAARSSAPGSPSVPRVVALVVQPAVEFDHLQVID